MTKLNIMASTLITTADAARALGDAILRASVAMRELETARTSEDIERVRHGVQHELEGARTILGIELPPPAPARPAKRDDTLRQLTIDAEDEGLYDEGTGFVETR